MSPRLKSTLEICLGCEECYSFQLRGLSGADARRGDRLAWAWRGGPMQLVPIANLDSNLESSMAVSFECSTQIAAVSSMPAPSMVGVSSMAAMEALAMLVPSIGSVTSMVDDRQHPRWHRWHAMAPCGGRWSMVDGQCRAIACDGMRWLMVVGVSQAFPISRR